MIFAKPSTTDYVTYLNDKYKIIYESVDSLNSFMDGADYLLEAEDKGILANKMDEFIEDAHKFIEDTKDSGNKKLKLAQTYSLIGLGIYVVGAALLIVDLPVLACITLIGSLITLCVGIYHGYKLQADVKKLEEYKVSLLKMKSKSDDKKVTDKLAVIIERIDAEVKSFKGNE